MRDYFGEDARRIRHAEDVAGYALEIAKRENANPAIIMAAAYLHDIGIREAERKFNSSAPRYQHTEGPPMARRILTELQAEAGLIDEVCDIISHHHLPRPDETLNFKVLYDADLIVNLDEQYRENPPTKAKLKKILDTSFLTDSGRELAENILLKRLINHEEHEKQEVNK
jgi:HD superfamily phosphohydrolase YqeK